MLQTKRRQVDEQLKRRPILPPSPLGAGSSQLVAGALGHVLTDPLVRLAQVKDTMIVPRHGCRAEALTLQARAPGSESSRVELVRLVVRRGRSPVWARMADGVT